MPSLPTGVFGFGFVGYVGLGGGSDEWSVSFANRLPLSRPRHFDARPESAIWMSLQFLLRARETNNKHCKERDVRTQGLARTILEREGSNGRKNVRDRNFSVVFDDSSNIIAAENSVVTYKLVLHAVLTLKFFMLVFNVSWTTLSNISRVSTPLASLVRPSKNVWICSPVSLLYDVSPGIYPNTIVDTESSRRRRT